MDYLEIIEKAIHERRMEKSVMPSQLKEKGFIIPTIYRIESHQNYSMKTLFPLLSELGIVMTVNGQDVRDKETLGRIIRETRLAKGLSQLDVIFKTKMSSSRLIAVERGRDYEKKTLNTYLEELSLELGYRYE
jgi:ribosome-binding protein aMBF1 (putative translation factor)